MVAADDDAELMRLIGMFYDAVIEPDLWAPAIDEIRQQFGFHNAALEVRALPSGEVVVQVSRGIPEDYLRRTADYPEEVLQLWGGPSRIAQYPLEEPILQSNATDPRGWLQNRYYTEWGMPQGLVEAVAIPLVRDRTMVASLAAGRHRSAPPLTEGDLRALRIVAPHLRRAATISRLLEIATTRAATFEAALEATGSGVVLVDPEMGIVHANGPAEAMLGRGDPIRKAGDKLALRHELVAGQLASAVGIASAEEGRLERRGIGIPARLRDGTPLAVHVMPLQRRSVRRGLQQRATAAVFVADNGSPPELPIDAMGLLYDLTPAEQRVFELIVAGRSTTDISATLGIATSTLRTHLLRVFEKTGRHNRAELVALSREVRLPG